MSTAYRMGFQTAGRGRLEGHPPGVVDGARFEGRFVVYSLVGPDGPVFGDDVSLFDAECVEKHGRGPQSAHLVAVRSGWVLEGFVTGEGDDFPGHTIGRTSAETRFRVFYDPAPDGTRHFDRRESFLRAELIATYQAEEFFQIDPASGVFDTRVNYRLLDSAPFTHAGRTIDLGDFAQQMVEKSHGRIPAPDPHPESIPQEAPFLQRGVGVFADRFAVGGSITII